MSTYKRIFVRDTAMGHAERNAFARIATKRTAVELAIEFAAINIEKAIDILEAKKNG